MEEERDFSEELDKLVVEENESNPINNANQYFIQQQHNKLPLEELVLATGLSSEVITDYIERYQSYLKQHGMHLDRQFHFDIAMNVDGTLHYRIEWPDPENIEKIIPYVGRFFFLINNGSLKESMVLFLQKHGEQLNANRLVKELFTVWNNEEKNKNEKPIIQPQDVFGSV
jgi:hypothetical protein